MFVVDACGTMPGVGGGYEQVDVVDERTARAEAAARNAVRDLRWTQWWAQPAGVGGTWRIVRARMVATDEAELPAEEFEEALRARVENALFGPTRRRLPEQSELELVPGTWSENLYEIRTVEVRLSGRCPDTVVEVVYEPLVSPGARFGMRFPIWPAEFKTVTLQAGQFVVYLGEASPGAHRKQGHCPDGEITWVDSRGRRL